MASTGKELPQDLKNLIVRLDKDGKWSRNISEQQLWGVEQTIVSLVRAAVAILLYLLIVTKTRQARASNSAQDLSLKMPEMVGRACHNSNLYGQYSMKKACLFFGTKRKYDTLLKNSRRGLKNMGRFFGPVRSGQINFPQIGSYMFTMTLVRTTTVNA